MTWATIGRARGLLRGTLLLPVALWCAGTGCGDDPPKSGNGVNDVRLACELRANWNRTDNQCNVCEAAVISPRCECGDTAAFSGACSTQVDARKPACPEAIDDCLNKCMRTDCTCIDACYAANAACKSASAARDGCQAEACAAHCK